MPTPELSGAGLNREDRDRFSALLIPDAQGHGRGKLIIKASPFASIKKPVTLKSGTGRSFSEKIAALVPVPLEGLVRERPGQVDR